MITRRKVLLGASGVVLAGVAGGSLFAATRTPHAARAPWQSPGALSADPRVAAMEWAVLAPNPHNRQPWLMAFSGTDEAQLYCQLDRRLPETDPFDRQVLIGLGCFMELFVLAAQDQGYDVRVSPFPEGAPPVDGRLDARPIAHLQLVPSNGLAKDPLFQHAPYRRSNKEAFDQDRALTADTMMGFIKAAGGTAEGTVDPAKVAALREVAWQAWQVEANTPRTHQESVNLMRIGKSEINRSPDGIDLGGAFLETLAVAGLLTRETLADPNSTAFKSGEDMYKGLIGSSQGFIWLTSDDDSRTAQLQAGRDWLRLNLAATGAGVATQPLSQALQEFPEMAGPFADVHDTLGVETPRRVQMLARIGYGPEVPPSPRWPASTRMVSV